MQGEVAQLRLAGHDRFRRPPHIEDHQAGEQREAGDRDGDEGQYAAHDLAARPRLRPRQARYGVPLRVGDVRDLLPVGLCRIVDLAQARQLQPVADVAQHVLVDIFDGKHDGRPVVADREIGLGADRHRRDDRRPAGELLDERGAPARLAGILGEDRNGAARDRGKPPAQQIETWRKLRAQVGNGGIAGRAEELVLDLIGTIDHDNDVVVEEGRQPGADAALHPLRVVVGADRERGAVGCRDALDLAQNPLAACGNRPPHQLLLAVERHLVGPMGGGQYRDDDADDRNGDDHADRHDEVQSHALPPRRLALLCHSRQRQRHNAPSLGNILARRKLNARIVAKSLVFTLASAGGGAKG
jgi:hypothetical protein